MKEGLKLSVLAAMFSAVFFVGGHSISEAYTYSGNTVTVDKVTEDESDLVLTNNSFVRINTNIAPLKIYTGYTSTMKNKSIKALSFIERDYNDVSDNTLVTAIDNIPSEMSPQMANDFFAMLKESIGNTYAESRYIRKSKAINEFNQKYNTNIYIRKQHTGKQNYDDECFKYALETLQYSENKIKTSRETGLPILIEMDSTVSYRDYSYVTSKEDSSITISNNSTLSANGNIQTSKAIKVTDNSFLKASGVIIGGDIYSDKAIISTTNDQGESVIASGDIKATGALKSDTYIGAWSGAVSGKTVYSGGDIVSANSIKAGSKATAKNLNVAAINATSATVTGNQSINGVFTTSGQAKLNGGATLGSKKITGLGAGTLSNTSAEAVNGSQIYTIQQGIAAKTYKAGSDIVISADHAISVSKSGTIKAGDAGVVTGATVYAETNSLNTKLNGLVDLVNTHQTKITSLQQQMGDLNQTITNINSQVATATGNLTSQLSKCLKTDMGNLTETGKTAIRNIVSTSLKSMGNQSSHAVSSVNKPSVATFEASVVNITKDTVSSKDISDIHTSLADKVDKTALDNVSASVSTNTKQIGSNAESIHSNATAISSLKTDKADITGSNIDVEKYAEKLGTGTVAKDNTGLVSGDSVYSALDKKADISYMDAGMNMVESQMQAVQQQATRDMNRVGAGASALAGLHPSAYDASDKLSFATGYGHYKNANTSALGAFYHPNEKTMVSMAGTIGNKDAMLSAGVSVKVGLGDKVSKVIITPKMFSANEVQNQEIKNHLDTQNEKLKEIEQVLSSLH